MEKEKAGIGKFERAVERISNLFMYFGASMLLIMMFLGVADVIGRYLFNSPIIGTIETFEILLPIIALCGLAYVQKEKGHIKVDLLYARFRPRLQSIIGLGITIWSMALFTLIAWRGTLIAISYWKQNRYISNIHMPIYIVQLLVPVGAALFCLVFIVDMIRFITDLRKGK